MWYGMVTHVGAGASFWKDSRTYLKGGRDPSIHRIIWDPATYAQMFDPGDKV